MAEDLRVELGELGSGLDPELFDEHLTCPSVGLQRIGLAPAAVQREHQVRMHLLAPRMLAGQLPQIGDELGMAPGGEARLHVELEGVQPLLLQPRDLGGGERQRREVAEWRAPPERERLVEHGGRPLGCVFGQGTAPVRDEPLEPIEVELAVVDTYEIAGGRREQPAVAAERSSQP